MLVKIYPDNPQPKEIERAAELLRQGGIVIYPTDTVYAIGCDALQVRAVEQICRIRGINPQRARFSVIGYDLSSLSQYVKIENTRFKLIKRNIPGPFTFILPVSASLPRLYKNRKTIGIRIPDNNIVREIVRTLGHPILSASLREDDDLTEYQTDPELIAEKYAGQADLIIDGGYGGLEPSTVIDCSGDQPEIVREGKGRLIG
ncbi:MAG: threonylcarbamoyl-AMP synthase [Coprobacter sp.]|nr:threonylcarbamoyl-AMP synthase [Coprobacter sp.]